MLPYDWLSFKSLSHLMKFMKETEIRNYDCIVVGSGLSGLVAARNIQRAGHNVLVLEAQDRIGGRMYGKHIAPDQYVDFGGQWVGPTHDRFLALLDEYKISRFPSPPLEGKTVLLYNGHRCEFNGFFQGFSEGERPDVSEEEWCDAMEAWSRFEELSKAMPSGHPSRTTQNQLLDSQTFTQWIDENTKTDFGHWYFSYMVRAVGFLGPAEPNQVSLLHVLWGNSCASQSEHPEAELIHDGAGQIPGIIAAELRNQIHISEPVVSICQDQTGVEVKTLQNSYRAKFAIVAMPPHLAGRISYDPPLPATRQQLTQRVPMGTIAKIMISYEAPFWRENGLGGVGMGNCEWIELFADSSDPRSGKGVIATFVVGDRYLRWQALNESERTSVILSNLAAYLGDEALSPSTFDVVDWSANQWVGGGYGAFMPPGVWTNFGDTIATPVGRIHWAGTETAERWPGFFDGAVRTGESAAEAVIACI